MSKVAKLVYYSFATRVVVDESSTEEDIIRASKRKILEKVQTEHPVEVCCRLQLQQDVALTGRGRGHKVPFWTLQHAIHGSLHPVWHRTTAHAASG